MHSFIKDGDLYKVVEVFGKRFSLCYGYYEAYERERGEPPIPIYPDFEKSPVYTEDGYPFVTQMQALCPHGESRFSEGLCADCIHYKDGAELIGICTCSQNRRISETTP